ncbi:putative T6SS immunity periplasmic lipoprotein [Atlantibacter hermannii]|uniref:putative T6SS immunity periplasmic lipoprotein n=1 Tax=Atlantibacter hermannii TaxID=565 RepID=UPI0019334E92|nr:putative T6SS immunity periplasmic lipoprotein [Atlantibacter hermannii]MBL7635232.1 hypothetical protein [Atlantibacter hermannii]MBL7673269.1 hypothetical protein [Atlantibacter hermannii]
MKKFLCLTFVSFLSGCHLERPYYYELNVSIIKNNVCFSVPSDIEKNHNNLEYKGMAIYRKGIKDWEFFSATPEQKLLSTIKPNQCLDAPDIKWKPGVYSVLAEAFNPQASDSLRFRKEFQIDLQEDGEIALKR